MVSGVSSRGSGWPARTLGVAASPEGSDIRLIEVAPAPVLARLEGLHYRVADRIRVGAGMTKWRGVAAADMPARQAQPQVDPGGADPQALLAALGRIRHHRADQAEVRVVGHRHLHPPIFACSWSCLLRN